RIKDRAIRRSPIVDPIASTSHRLAIVPDVPGYADPRSKISRVLRHMLGLRHGRIWSNRPGDLFEIVAKAIVQCQIVPYLPLVFPENRIIISRELNSWQPEALLERAVLSSCGVEQVTPIGKRI